MEGMRGGTRCRGQATQGMEQITKSTTAATVCNCVIAALDFCPVTQESGHPWSPVRPIRDARKTAATSKKRHQDEHLSFRMNPLMLIVEKTFSLT